MVLLLPATGHAQKTPSAEAIDVVDYDVTLDVDPVTGTIHGSEALTAVALDELPVRCVLDAAGLDVDSVSVDGAPTRFDSDGERITIFFPEPVRRGDSVTVVLRYHGRPVSGLRFDGDQAYTAFSTERWLVCNADPADKATITLRLAVPDTSNVVAGGRLMSREPLPSGRRRYVWRSDVPWSAYLYGFATGPFSDTSVVDGGRTYRYVGMRAPSELARIFAITPDVFRYFERRAGVSLPDSVYTQVLLRGDVEQEAVDMALLRESYADEVLADPREDWLIVHEAAHQWWGNMVTCRDWSEFWLNEGFATFMTAAFKEFYRGREEYERETMMARLRYARLRERGGDRPLHFTDWTTPQQANSPAAYYKGSAFLHYLRFVLGEEGFWEGISTYTRAGFGRSVTSADLRAAFESASGLDLGRLFREWVESGDAPALSAEHELDGDEVIVRIVQNQPSPFELPMRVAVETTSGRQTRRVVVDGRSAVVRFPVVGRLLSVRIDDGGYLPVSVAHERPPEMLLYQALHEPDVAGRVDAILAMEKLADSDPATVSAIVAALQTSVATDPSRLVRQIAVRALARTQ